MKHRVHGRKLNRSPAHRIALRRNLARSLFLTFDGKKHIITTREKAKFVQPFAEKLITLAKEKTLHNYRRAIALLCDETAVHTLFEEIGPAYRDRPGGYTRVVRLQRRRLGDRASQVILGFVLDQEAPQEAAVVDSEAG
jgi:large subunit ribosomal protein L17